MDVGEYRGELALIRREAADRLTDIFPQLNFKDLEGSSPLWITAVDRVVTDAHGKTVSVAQDAYMSMRRAAGARGTVSFVLPSVDHGKLRASLAWLGPQSGKKAMSAGARITDVADTVYSNTTARAVLDILSGARETVRRTSLLERVGWKRIARDGACRFCLMLADRGAVYKEATASFGAHLHCECTAVRADGSEPEASAFQYLGSKRNRTAKDRALLNGYLDAFYPRS